MLQYKVNDVKYGHIYFFTKLALRTASNKNTVNVTDYHQLGIEELVN